jgi:Recombination endonuclease VII
MPSDYKDWYDRNVAPFPEKVADLREYNRLKQQAYRARVKQEEPKKWEAMLEAGRQRSRNWHAGNKPKRGRTLAEYRQAEAYHQGLARRSRKHAHGIIDEQYQDLLIKQGGVCAICKQLETARHKRTGRIHGLTVDHDHTTGVVRGLLCRRCNNAIGWLDDDYERAQGAANYLLLSTTAYTSHRTQRLNAYVKK